MTEEIIIDKEEFWDMFEQNPINAVEGLFSKIETIVNLLKRLEQENEKLKKENAELLTVSCLLEDNKYRKALETIKVILDTKCSIVSNAECVGIINEVLG